MNLRAIGVMTLLVVGSGLSQAQVNLSDTRSTLQQWVQTRQIISETRSEWVADQDMLKSSKSMFENELKQLSETLAEIEGQDSKTDGEIAGQEAKKAALLEYEETGKQLATKMEARLKALIPSFPDKFRSHITPYLDRLPENPVETKETPGRRLQLVVAILAEVDKFNNSLHLETEVRGDISVRTLYLGLAQAYFVNNDGTVAGTGGLGANGWEWTETPALAPQIQKAIAIYEGTHPAEFISLPVAIK